MEEIWDSMKYSKLQPLRLPHPTFSLHSIYSNAGYLLGNSEDINGYVIITKTELYHLFFIYIYIYKIYILFIAVLI